MVAEHLPTGTVPVNGPHPLAPRLAVVKRHTRETVDTVTLVLSSPTGEPFPRFVPGQFNMLYLPGIGEAAISISGDPKNREELIHTVRAAGKISNALSALLPGATVGFRGPYGHGWPLEKAVGKDLLILAGGLGLPPLRPLLYELLSQRERFGRVEIVYGARSPGDLVHYSQVQEWRRRSDIRFQTTVDAAGRDWYGDVGVVTTRIPDMRFDAANSVAFLCGPEIMMKLTARALEARGVPKEAMWVSMERNMKCAIGFCGHCQFGPSFICRDGPVLNYKLLEPLLWAKEV
ncbi:MAG TPA: FAD/NAD(P)-binding protein [Thermoplasmata archaeon]|nr:FAD/NAD(P)-binding protein [Thermoplasmata archaeon]